VSHLPGVGTWQLIINTGTTIITEALQLKLDELIGVNGNARNRRVPPLPGPAFRRLDRDTRHNMSGIDSSDLVVFFRRSLPS
jgi:hypothetical protein